jgi:cobalt-zinc-cadmium efflux system membrane fusion protein
LQSADIAQARSDFEKAKIEVLRADRALDRGKLLLAHDVLSQADYYELEATDKAAHSEQERARQRIQEYGFTEDGVTDTVPIKAPIAGAVLDIGTATGELQRSLDNAATIATIANLDAVWVVGDVFERDLGSVQVGRQVNILVPAYPQTTLTGRVDNISDAIDPTTHTLKLRVVLNNPGHKLKTDMFATIRVPGAPRTLFVIPATAIFYEGDKTYVFVSGAQNKLEKREVVVGRTVDADGKKNIEVVSGLNDGDKVVAVGSALLRPVSGD